MPVQNTSQIAVGSSVAHNDRTWRGVHWIVVAIDGDHALCKQDPQMCNAAFPQYVTHALNMLNLVP